MLIATKAMALKTIILKQRVDASLLRKACETVNNGALWKVEQLLKMPKAADKDCFFEEGWAADVSTLFWHLHRVSVRRCWRWWTRQGDQGKTHGTNCWGRCQCVVPHSATSGTGGSKPREPHYRAFAWECTVRALG